MKRGLCLLEHQLMWRVRRFRMQRKSWCRCKLTIIIDWHYLMSCGGLYKLFAFQNSGQQIYAAYSWWWCYSCFPCRRHLLRGCSPLSTSNRSSLGMISMVCLTQYWSSKIIRWLANNCSTACWTKCGYFADACKCFVWYFILCLCL